MYTGRICAKGMGLCLHSVNKNKVLTMHLASNALCIQKTFSPFNLKHREYIPEK